ncbi:CPBP family intramembrane glutamic endopeptidase [Flavobacterium wongokense]|uniref:CPBP family intramembrane glutamic endopeptidase n=1 Tax=Flavobacterium wongokense TaxID=2910674 RepID=UPI001F28A682|nr:CPBP family intramembrane glutamic endopeptidase [Flavobacterium sp. WG47]MCF6132269.1 CPBP family intramembrane metalloprotease [Flavobacterium sp. WG47]
MFIELALKGNNKWWRVVTTIILSAGIFIANIIAFFILPQDAIDKSTEMMKSFSNNVALTLNLLPFVFLLGLLFLLVYALHNRSIMSLTTSRSRFDFKRFFFSFGIIVFFIAASFAISYYTDSSEIIWNFNPSKFAVLCILSLLLFPFQIGLEEYLFRGYLMQQIGIAAGNRWTPLLITSVMFGLLHSANPEVAEMGYGVMVFYIGTGFLLGIMTLMDEGMELSLGFHLGNNLMAAILITSEFSALQTDAMFKYSGKVDTADTLNEMIISMLILYPLILFILAKKYKWSNWKEKLTGTIAINKIAPTENLESHE